MRLNVTSQSTEMTLICGGKNDIDLLVNNEYIWNWDYMQNCHFTPKALMLPVDQSLMLSQHSNKATGV